MCKISFGIGITYILFFMGSAAAKIGTSVDCSSVYTVEDVIGASLAVVTPFVLGYQAGKEN